MNPNGATPSRYFSYDQRNLVTEARAASQVYAATLRRLTTAQALHSPDTLKLSAAEYMARTHHQRALAALNT
jgi:hypothetical protein